jgi:hypothetical protein
MENPMKRLALLSLPLLCLSTPTLSADLGPSYSERDIPIERPAPRIVERERIIEHHYYELAPVYRERRVYVEPREYVYAPRAYAPDIYYDGPYRYAYSGWRPHHFFPRRAYWHRHHYW